MISNETWIQLGKWADLWIDKCKKLESENTQLRNGEWIPFAENTKPDHGTRVLVKLQNEYIVIASCFYNHVPPMWIKDDGVKLTTVCFWKAI